MPEEILRILRMPYNTDQYGGLTRLPLDVAEDKLNKIIKEIKRIYARQVA